VEEIGAIANDGDDRSPGRELAPRGARSQPRPEAVLEPK
jgi:hypothetical protein